LKLQKTKKKDKKGDNPLGVYMIDLYIQEKNIIKSTSNNLKS